MDLKQIIRDLVKEEVELSVRAAIRDLLGAPHDPPAGPPEANVKAGKKQPKLAQAAADSATDKKPAGKKKGAYTVYRGVRVGEQWCGRTGRAVGRTIEIVSLGRTHIVPKVVKGHPRSKAKKIGYEVLFRTYDRVEQPKPKA